eukprot:TRINITY_DN4036_c0_g1_i1.p1 TRINITY_DN4036_c0_g1~~TRINITY_DN4036_c0_g1_i1.p1  ORF type:complete len:211 (+),score=31.15 TRINITY_DN4036_c0_g1_i1:67-699(+)
MCIRDRSMIHYILYTHKVYPENAFEPKVVFGLQSKVAKPGILFDYIHNLVEDVREFLETRSLDGVILTILERDGPPIEYTLNIENFEQVDTKIHIFPDKLSREIEYKRSFFSFMQKCDAKADTVYDRRRDKTYHFSIISNGRENMSADNKMELLEKWLLDKRLHESSPTPLGARPTNEFLSIDFGSFRIGLLRSEAVSYTHLTLPTIYSV